MIAVYCNRVIYPGDDTLYQIDAICHINPAQVCSTKPVVMLREGVEDRDVDIATADGMRYRVNKDDPGLWAIRQWGSLFEVVRNEEEMLKFSREQLYATVVRPPD